MHDYKTSFQAIYLQSIVHYLPHETSKLNRGWCQSREYCLHNLVAQHWLTSFIENFQILQSGIALFELNSYIDLPSSPLCKAILF